MVFVTQKAMVYHLNIAVSAGAAIGKWYNYNVYYIYYTILLLTRSLTIDDAANDLAVEYLHDNGTGNCHRLQPGVGCMGVGKVRFE